MKRQIGFNCIDDPSYDDYVNAGNNTVGCGLGYSGLIFFFSYFTIMRLIIMNLFIALVLQSYDEVKHKEDRLFNDEMLLNFIKCW